MNKIIDILRTFIGGCLLCYGAVFIVIGYAILPRDMREVLKGKIDEGDKKIMKAMEKLEELN